MADRSSLIDNEPILAEARSADIRRIRTQLALLADACDLAPAPSRSLDAQIAALVCAAPALGSGKPGRRPGAGAPIRIPRYSSLPLSALTLVPTDHWLEHCAGAGPSVAIHGPGESGMVASARSRQFALAICAASLRAHARLTTALPRGAMPNPALRPTGGAGPDAVVAAADPADPSRPAQSRAASHVSGATPPAWYAPPDVRG